MPATYYHRLPLEQFCHDCGVPQRLHYGVTGRWLGCEIAKVSQRANDWPRDPERWNDPFLDTTLKLRAALVDGSCGPLMEAHMSHYTNDEQLAIATLLGRIARSADIEAIAKKAGAL